MVAATKVDARRLCLEIRARRHHRHGRRRRLRPRVARDRRAHRAGRLRRRRVIGVRAVAEFVESDALLATLRDIGVDYVQGYTVHEPEPLALAARGAAEPA
jgi:hypothetical protein